MKERRTAIGKNKNETTKGSEDTEKAKEKEIGKRRNGTCKNNFHGTLSIYYVYTHAHMHIYTHTHMHTYIRKPETYLLYVFCAWKRDTCTKLFGNAVGILTSFSFLFLLISLSFTSTTAFRTTEYASMHYQCLHRSHHIDIVIRLEWNSLLSRQKFA